MSFLILGLLWLAIGMGSFLAFHFEGVERVFYVFFIAFAFLNTLFYLTQYFNQYLTLKNNFIKENFPFGKKINLSEIKEIKRFAGDYQLKTDRTTLTINTTIIAEDSLKKLTVALEELNLVWT
jgi:hypothetical protein|tara:strand:+ start:512 stop:880 length:369 start_codon:yes stop_codon:yes gene_type:complete